MQSRVTTGTGLREHDSQNYDASPRAAERRAQLLAAAKAARTWIHDRRAEWPDRPAPGADVRPPFVAAPLVDLPPAFAHVPVASPPPIVEPAPTREIYRPQLAQPPAAAPAPPATPTYMPPPAPAFEVPVPPVPYQAPAPPSYEAAAPAYQPPPAYQPAPAIVQDLPPQAHERPAATGYDAVPMPAYVPAAPDVMVAPVPAPPRRSIDLTKHARAIGQPIARYGVHVVVAAAVVAALGAATWSVRAYWAKLAAMPKTGMALLESTPPGSEVLVDGKPMGNAPVTAELKPGPHVVEFRRRKASRTVEINIVAGESTTGRVDWSAKRNGRLAVQTDPPGAKVAIDGKPRGVTPLTVEDLPAGSHVVVLEGASGTVRRTVEIAGDTTAELNESIFSGWLHVSSPIEVEITEGTRQIHLDDKNLVLLAPGAHELKFVSRPLGFADTRHVEIKAGQTISVSISPASSSLTVTSTAAAEVFIDGERAGDTPLTDHPVSLGTRDIMVKSQFGERRVTLTVGTKPARVDIDFSKP